MKCPKCFENKIPNTANFCPSCGNQLRPGKFVVMDISEKKVKESPKKIIVPSLNVENGHEWVDLGLSVKWATCNIGASSPEECGGYYAWGEISTKDRYTKDNYCFHDNPSVLPMFNDVAHVKWGGKWRMPTLAEQKELMEKCHWTLTSEGYRVVGPNKCSIIFPLAGYRFNSFLNNVSTLCFYWSASMRSSDNAYVLNLQSVIDNSRNRFVGLPVRAVCPLC